MLGVTEREEKILEREEKRQEEVYRKYMGLLVEIEEAFRREALELPNVKNIIPTKIYLPREKIEFLLELRDFERVYKRKRFFWKAGDSWYVRDTYPNIGGIPVVEGEKVRVEVIALDPKKRVAKIPLRLE